MSIDLPTKTGEITRRRVVLRNSTSVNYRVTEDISDKNASIDTNGRDNEPQSRITEEYESQL